MLAFSSSFFRRRISISLKKDKSHVDKNLLVFPYRKQKLSNVRLDGYPDLNNLFAASGKILPNDHFKRPN